MDLQKVLKKIEVQISLKRPFVLYRMPNSETVLGLFQQNSDAYSVEETTQEGFMFSPFNHKKASFFIPNASCDSVTFQILKKEDTIEDYHINHTNKEAAHHIELVQKALDKIQDSILQKVVISRKKEVQFKNFQLSTLIDNLFSSRHTAFRYLWFHPATDFWCGASPETLVKLEGNNFSTMALAGTKRSVDNLPPQWTHKEYYEQQIVTDAIYDSLHNLTPVLKVSKPYNHKSGNLFHIRTDITGVIRNSNAKLSKILKVLHPTPAVCGMPTSLAKRYIEDHEGYDRSFYTGYLGPVHMNKTNSQLFVNLRCMQFSEKKATIYVGGGIVPESIAEKEWEETCLKMQPMANLIGAML